MPSLEGRARDTIDSRVRRSGRKRGFGGGTAGPEETNELGRRRERECGWIGERISVVDMEFGMRERSGRADSRRHATRAHEKLWLLPPVNREGQPTKNNITFNGQPNFVARWWATDTATRESNREGRAVCYRSGTFMSFKTPVTTSVTTATPSTRVINDRKTFAESPRLSAAGFVKDEDELHDDRSSKCKRSTALLS